MKRTIIFGLLLAGSAGAGTGAGYVWGRGAVVPVVLVKPAITGFEAVEGGSISQRWEKDEVRPVVLVEQDAFRRFVSPSGSRIGNEFDAKGVLAVVVTEPCRGDFVPVGLCAGAPK